MLSKVASAIMNHNDCDLIVSRERALKMAETILQVQKEAGMLPPLSKLNALGVKDNAWEPEDEA